RWFMSHFKFYSALRMQLGDNHSEVIKLTNLYHNLMRKWAEL
ncbi:TPA: hypothetical protein ACIJS7_003867, partial [Acinetobacter baumannii]